MPGSPRRLVVAEERAGTNRRADGIFVLIKVVAGCCMAYSHSSSFVCLFVCLVYGVPVVCGGRRLTKDGPYATRRQAEAVLFVRRKPTPPFAGCQGNLLFRGSRGLQTGRPVDHRPYSARHVGLLVGSFWNNKCTTNPVPPRPPPLVGMARYASTPRRHTVEVCASLGPQQARPPP